MKFYGIDLQGYLKLETVDSLPTFDSDDDYRRLLYNENDNKIYYGKNDRWNILSGGIGEPVTNFVSTGTLYTDKLYLIDTTTSSKSGTLTNSSLTDGDIITVLDVGGNFGTNSFTVNAGSGDTINGISSFNCTSNNAFYQFIYYSIDNDWQSISIGDISTFSISDLADVSGSSPSDDNVLQYNDATGQYEPVNLGGGTGDDEVYGLIRYQASPPIASDEIVYVDSDDDTFYIYDDGTSTWKSISGSGTGTASVSGGGLPQLMTDDMSLDDTNVNVDRGKAFGMVETIDFGPGADGSIWATFHFPSTSDDTKDINISAIYNLEGIDDLKTISIDLLYWAYGDSVTPDSGTPDATNNDSIGSSTTQGERQTKALSTIPSSAITDGDTITIKLTRKGSLDTYTGTFQLLYLYLYQS